MYPDTPNRYTMVLILLSKENLFEINFTLSHDLHGKYANKYANRSELS